MHAVVRAAVIAVCAALSGCSDPIAFADAGPSDADSEGPATRDGCGDRDCAPPCCPAGASCLGGGACCGGAAPCGGVCCASDQRCEAEACVRDCGAQTRCETTAGATCCTADQVCHLAACVRPGSRCDDGAACPAGTYCEPALSRCLPQPDGPRCEYRPPVAAFAPQLEWAWTGDADALPEYRHVSIAPLVANLTDDNGDGRIDRDDVPDVIFSAFRGAEDGVYYYRGVLRAVSGDDGHRLWPADADPGFRTSGASQLALANVDGLAPGPEIVACSDHRTVLIVSAAGRLLADHVHIPCWMYSAPAIGDLDGDGVPEIVLRDLAFHADGTLVPGLSVASDTRAESDDDLVTLADVDADGRLELVLSNRVVAADGRVVWRRADLASGFPAVADLDGDGGPEVVLVQSRAGTVVALDGRTGVTRWGPMRLSPDPMDPRSTTHQSGGPPTLADQDGDGAPDLATAGAAALFAFAARTGSRRWSAPSRDLSSGVTGTSIFDFEGDGRAEVLYADEVALRAFRGTDGGALLEYCNTSATQYEYPVVVDVDNDGQAEIVVAANAHYRGLDVCADGTPSVGGVRVYGDAAGNWVRTRRIWNEHTYHVTNIDEDGRVPLRERPNWTVPGLNNFRQNVQPEGLFYAPDLVVADLAADVTVCESRVTLRARIANRGWSAAPTGVPVTFYEGVPGRSARLGRVVTPRRLLPGEALVVALAVPIAPGMRRDVFAAYAVVNDARDSPLATLRECRDDNNASGPRQFPCTPPG